MKRNVLCDSHSAMKVVFRKDQTVHENEVVIKDLTEKLKDLEAKLNAVQQNLTDQISGSTILEQKLKSSKVKFT